MRVLVLCSSGNTDGFTSNMCRIFDECAINEGHESEVIHLHELKIIDCNGCAKCQNGKICVLRDDAEKLFKKMESVDLLVMATPIRFNGPSSIMKRFIDRLNPYWYSGRKHPQYACGLMCGGSVNPNFDHARSEMVSASNTVEMKWLGELCMAETDFRERTDGRVEKFAKDILGLIQK